MRKLTLAFFLVACLFLLCVEVPSAEAKLGLVIWEGKWPKSGWLFVTKFCFDNDPHQPGVIRWNATAVNGSLDGLKLAIYDDQPMSFPALKKNRKHLTCEEMIKPVSEKGFAKSVRTLHDHKNFELRITETYPRFWYVALSTCNVTSTKGFEMLLHFENPGSWWNREFSKDRHGVLPLYLFFFIFYVIVGSIYGLGLFTLWRQSSLHMIVRLFSVSLYLYIAGVFLIWVHFTKYASDGFGVYGLEGLGMIFKIASEVIFICLLLFVASGWTISTHELRFRNVFVGIFGTLVFLYVVLFIWAEIGVSPESTVYFYDTPPGIILALLRIPLMVFFAYLAVKSFIDEVEPAKKKFYAVFGVIYSIWFLILPFVVFIAFAIYAWDRFITIEAITMVLYALSLSGMCALLWPQLADRLFAISITPGSSVRGATAYDTL